jgi:hypothetical protein
MVPFSVLAQPPKSVELANPFTYSVFIDTIEQQIPSKGAQFGPFELIDISPASKANEYLVTMIAYQSGTYSLPVSLEKGADTSKVYAITVAEPAPEKVETYLPPKEIAFPEPSTSNFPWIPIFITLIVLAAGLYYWFKTRKKKTPEVLVKLIDILEKLAELKKDWIAGKTSAETLGESLEKWTKIHVGLQGETMINQVILKARPLLSKTHFEAISHLLHDCTYWRFGKQIPSMESGLKSIHVLEEIVKSNPDIS